MPEVPPPPPPDAPRQGPRPRRYPLRQRGLEKVLDAQPAPVIGETAEQTAPTDKRGIEDAEAAFGLTNPLGPGVPGEIVPEPRDPQPGEEKGTGDSNSSNDKP